jgi:GntR family transcriptional regulator/MocR family aminotransferase
MIMGPFLKARRTPGSSALPFTLNLDATADEPLFRQLYHALREAILSGRLKPGSKLPSTRVLAVELSIARNTASVAYDYLHAEGYITSATGSGTFVSRAVKPQQKTRSQRNPTGQAPTAHRPSRTAKTLLTDQHATPASPGAPRPFRLGEPDVDAFPTHVWSRLLTQHARRAGPELLSYGDANGYRLLRRAVLEYVTSARGVRAELEQVFLVRGAQQAVDLIARLLLNPGDMAWVEDPGYLATRAILTANGVQIAAVPVDRDGLVVDEGAQRSDARAAFVTPSNHFPLGVTMSLGRRLQLLAWAAERGAWIIEDDYDSEFYYSGRPLPSLQVLDRSGLVVYIGTFSKTMFPALRLGYLIVPQPLVPLFERARERLDAIVPSIEQAALADFIVRGEYARHIRRMRELYRNRQAFLVQRAQAQLSPWLHMPPVEVGMHLVGWLDQQVKETRAEQLAWDAGVEVRSLSRYTLEQPLAPALVFGFAAYDERATARAIQRLQTAFSTIGR